MENSLITMQKKKMLIGGAIAMLLFVPLVFFALKQTSSSQSSSPQVSPTGANTTMQQTQRSQSFSPTPFPGTAVLSFQKQSATSTAIFVDTRNKPVSAVQLAISFDPSILGNVSIKPGNFFNQALVLINKIDYTTGTIFYAAVVPPNAVPQQGKGVVAWLTYEFAQGSINPTSLQFLPNTKITARGIDNSVLKEASSISIASTGR